MKALTLEPLDTVECFNQPFDCYRPEVGAIWLGIAPQPRPNQYGDCYGNLLNLFAGC